MLTRSSISKRELQVYLCVDLSSLCARDLREESKFPGELCNLICGWLCETNHFSKVLLSVEVSASLTFSQIICVIRVLSQAKHGRIIYVHVELKAITQFCLRNTDTNLGP